MRKNKLEVTVVLCLLMITGFIYFMQQHYWHKSFTIDAHTAFEINAISDIGTATGKSKSSYVIENEKIILSCEIIASDYLWPFCELAIQFYDFSSKGAPFGIDLSSFDTVSIYAKYINLAPHGVRFQLRNFNPVYSNLKDDGTLKFNGTEYFLYGKNSRIDIPLTSLQVAPWWVFEQKLPMKYAAPELDNIMVLELATGNGIKPGKYQIELDKIVFTGKYFTNENVYIALMSIWINASLFLLLYHSHQKREKLNKLHTQQLRDKVNQDPLTGALNRTGVNSLLLDDIQTLSVAFIDLDFFKKINDTLGHAAGDDILCEFTDLLSQNSRDTDFVARWGGEEFLLLCPNTTLSQMAACTEVIRRMITEHQWPHNIELTASFGLAERGNESLSDFIARADKALYNAKVQGRNRVVIST
ncbi:GGDEF domain-containing protein [Colwellia sp. D2M02]|uniref:GGDEF domain-containing protein n=1 Tax=Colwellia sp. D2M02 TaxID=2841562 RepID=UPI001C0A14AB|nr:GGDEF domain-containing protein [Colwellia sp. D2M02]MBU2891993.1 GGDEF domain-containing protein [Colwellia sp. D2M02]